MNHILTGRYAVHLIDSLLQGTAPENKPEEISFEDLYRLSVFHNVSTMCLSALKKTDQVIEPELLKKWENRSALSTGQSMTQLHERKSIYEALEENKIDYLPLKGCLLKDMYPDPNYREMSDLDILIREKDADQIKSLMENMGYTCSAFRQYVHDGYYRKPFMHVEMHYRLFSEDHFQKRGWDVTHSDFFINPWKYAHKADGCRYRFDEDDLYVYLIMHLAKHYLGSGAGIRQFTDLYFLNQNLQLNIDAVYEKLDQFGLKEFCITAEHLVEMWYQGREPDEKTSEMESIVFRSGSYGTQDISLNRQMDKYEKEHSSSTFLAHYMRERLFPSYGELKNQYPGLRDHPERLPVYWTKRILTKGVQAVPQKLKDAKAISRILKERKGK